jgi:hypothetical protein
MINVPLNQTPENGSENQVFRSFREKPHEFNGFGTRLAFHAIVGGAKSAHAPAVLGVPSP